MSWKFGHTPVDTNKDLYMHIQYISIPIAEAADFASTIVFM